MATPTARQQRDLETRIASIYRDLADLDAEGRVHRIHPEALNLQRDRHARYAAAGAGRLPSGFASLDASRPWICYWVLHSLALLGAPLPEGITKDDVIAFLGACQAEGGGYGGGPGQIAHLAPTYAAVCALLTLGGEEAYSSIDRAAAGSFLRRMVVPPERGGGFTMHEGEGGGGWYTVGWRKHGMRGRLHLAEFLSRVGGRFLMQVCVGVEDKMQLFRGLGHVQWAEWC